MLIWLFTAFPAKVINLTHERGTSFGLLKEEAKLVLNWTMFADFS